MGFLFDAAAIRVALQVKPVAEPHMPAVSAVLAVEGSQQSKAPQQPQQPQAFPNHKALLQPHEPQQTQGYAPDIAERAAIAEHEGGIPAPYADGFALLQCQRPFTVTEAQWRQLLDDAGRFFDQWGRMAADWGWTAGELLDVPRDDLTGGLLWELQGERIEAFGPQHARTESGRIIERLQMQGTQYVATP